MILSVLPIVQHNMIVEYVSDAFSGGSADWAKGVAGIKYTYTVELRDKGQYGFTLPEKYVVPVGKELWAGFQVVAQAVINKTKTQRRAQQRMAADEPSNSQNNSVRNTGGRFQTEVSLLLVKIGYLCNIICVLCIIKGIVL